MEQVLTERDKLRDAINKIANLRKQEMEGQKTLREDLEVYKKKAENNEVLTLENKRLQEASAENTEQMKTVIIINLILVV